MLKIITANTNGIRSAASKGFFEWLEKQNADVVCIQETKAQIDQLQDAVFCPAGYHCYYFDAQRKGYSGTAVFSRLEPQSVQRGLGWDPADSEGRYLQVDFPKLSVVSLYMPSGSSSEEAQQKKFDFLDRFLPHLRALREQQREFIICADWNICHREIDLKNWKSNQKNSGFLPEERAWLDRIYSELGYVDAFRVINQQAEQYTWWSNRGQARAKNVGWRLDYHVITPNLVKAIHSVEIYTDEKFSDHAPCIINYDTSLS